MARFLIGFLDFQDFPEQERCQEPKVLARNQKPSPGTKGLPPEPKGRLQEPMALAESFRFLGATSALVRVSRGNQKLVPRNRAITHGPCQGIAYWGIAP